MAINGSDLQSILDLYNTLVAKISLRDSLGVDDVGAADVIFYNYASPPSKIDTVSLTAANDVNDVRKSVVRQINVDINNLRIQLTAAGVDPGV